jgi:hypothetical protein
MNFWIIPILFWAFCFATLVILVIRAPYGSEDSGSFVEEDKWKSTSGN